MTLARFRLPAMLLAPATAMLLATTAAADTPKGSLLIEQNRDSALTGMTPRPYMIEDRVVVVGPTMDHEAYETLGGEDILSNYQEWTFETEDRIIEIVQDVYDEDAPYASGGDLPRSVTTQLNVGATLPEGVETRPLNDELKERLPEGVEWTAIGEHLIALDDYGRIAHVYWDMLPLPS